MHTTKKLNTGDNWAIVVIEVQFVCGHSPRLLQGRHSTSCLKRVNFRYFVKDESELFLRTRLNDTSRTFLTQCSSVIMRSVVDRLQLTLGSKNFFFFNTPSLKIRSCGYACNSSTVHWCSQKMFALDVCRSQSPPMASISATGAEIPDLAINIAVGILLFELVCYLFLFSIYRSKTTHTLFLEMEKKYVFFGYNVCFKTGLNCCLLV